MTTDRVLSMAVVGCGYLGRFHAEKVAKHPRTRLVAVIDADVRRARTEAEKYGARFGDDLSAVLDEIDAACVVTPTTTHHAVAKCLLEAGKHVLLEKPIAADVAEAADLVRLAGEHGRVLQIGHLERFNPIWEAAGPEVGRPWYMNIERLAVFGERGIDVNVLMDLMIHDLDLVLHMLGDDPLDRIDAVGVPVITSHIDIANVRLQFQSGTVANITASRVSQKRERKLRLFQENAYLSIDLQERKAEIVRRLPGPEGGFPQLSGQALEAPPGDAIYAELDAFVASLLDGAPVRVPGEDGLRALELAVKIRDEIGKHPLAPKVFGGTEG